MAEKKSESREAPARWDPFADLWRRRGRLLPRTLAEVFDEALEEWPSGARALQPALDVHENDKQYTVTVELPGSKRDDVTVELHDNVLTIRGEKKSEREEKKEHARYVERRFGSFSRSFTLPSDALVDKIDASFAEGVLTLTVPKSEEAKPRTIAIKS
jgi:HSP20 family protein